MSDNDDDFFVDDVLDALNKKKAAKKKVNSKDKGVRGERNLCDILMARFPDRKGFFRVVGSGAHSHRANMTDQAKEVLTSDIVCPEGFKFSIECKFGYKDYDLLAAFGSRLKGLDEFLEQSTRDADKVGKKPWLCWKKPRQGWVCFMRAEHAPIHVFPVKLYYHEWVAVPLAELLASQPDDYFFES